MALPDLPLPPAPVTTRWRTWLQAAFYYSDHFTEVKSVVDTFDCNEADSIGAAQNSFAETEIMADLAYLKAYFASIVSSITKLEEQGLRLAESLRIIVAV